MGISVSSSQAYEELLAHHENKILSRDLNRPNNTATVQYYVTTDPNVPNVNPINKRTSSR